MSYFSPKSEREFQESSDIDTTFSLYSIWLQIL